MRVNHPLTRGPVVPTGSKLRNRFCFNAAERERRRFESTRAAETILEDTHQGEHMQYTLPAVNGFSCHTREKDHSFLNDPIGEASTYEDDSDEEMFWTNLEDTPLDDLQNPVDSTQVHHNSNDFTLFSRTF